MLFQEEEDLVELRKLWRQYINLSSPIDRNGNKRFHIHSLSGMMHYNPAETYNDYMDMFRIANKLNLSQKEKEQRAKQRHAAKGAVCGHDFASA